MSLLRRNPKAAEIKRERKERIYEAARDCLFRLPASRVTLQALARQAGVSEGLPSMYFGSLEELLAKVAAAELTSWAEAARVELSAGSALTTSAAAERLAELIADHPLLTRTLAAVPLLLESATEADPAEAIQTARNEAVAAVARAVAGACPDLLEHDSAVLIERLLVFAAGLEPRLRPLGGVALVAGAPSVDASVELKRVANALAADAAARLS